MAHRILHGDCIEHMRAMPDSSIDLIVTDPPYGMAYRSDRRTATERFDAVEGDAAFDPAFHEAWIEQAFRLLRDGGAVYSFTSDHNLGAFRAVFAWAGFTVKRTLVWVKNAWTSGDLEGDYGHQTEFVVYATKGRHTLHGGRETNVLRSARIPPGDLRHPCQKPVDLLEYLIRKSSNEGGTVLDPFCGSGSTGVAARMAARDFIGIESDAEHVATATERCAAAHGVPRLFSDNTRAPSAHGD